MAYSAEALLARGEHDVSLKPAFRHEARAHVNWNIAEEEKTLCCITIDEKKETTMVQSEDEVLKAAQAILEQKQYQKLRNYIYVSALCRATHVAQFRGREGKRCRRNAHVPRFKHRSLPGGVQACPKRVPLFPGKSPVMGK